MKYSPYEKNTLEVYEFCDIRTFPIDCMAVAQKIGLDVTSYRDYARGNSELLKELMKTSPDAFIVPGRMKIYFNDKAYCKRILFSIAHEIGHAVLVSDDEDEADEFASELLMPRSIIYALKLNTAEKISEFFGVSISAANQALISKWYVPSETGEQIIRHFHYEDKCPELFWMPSESDMECIPRPEIKAIPIEKTEVRKPSEKEWRKKTHKIEDAIMDTRYKMRYCQSEKQYQKLDAKLSELQIRMRWQEEEGDRYGYCLTE